jgi:hypothetical protein
MAVLLLRYPTLLTACFFLLSSLIGLVAFDQHTATTTDDYWSSPTNHGRCEETRGNEHRFLRERANALSNLVFMGVGLYCCGAATYDFRLFRLMTSLSCPSPVPPSPSTSTPSTPQPHSYRAIRGGLALQPLLSFAYGVSVFLGGYGSFLYHASAGSPLGGQMDIWSIFVMCNAVATLIFYTMATSITSAILPKSRFPPKLCNTILAFACIAFLVWLDNFSWNWHEHFWLGSWDAMYVRAKRSLSGPQSTLTSLCSLPRRYTLLIQFVGSITASAAFLVVCLYALNNKHRAVPFFPLGLVYAQPEP